MSWARRSCSLLQMHQMAHLSGFLLGIPLACATSAACISPALSWPADTRKLPPLCSWVANGAHDTSHRRSLQQDVRPTPAHGHYPRRRSLQVEDWRPAPNPFARVSDTVGPDGGAFPPVPLQVKTRRWAEAAWRCTACLPAGFSRVL